jgi:hypothetical protein
MFHTTVAYMVSKKKKLGGGRGEYKVPKKKNDIGEKKKLGRGRGETKVARKN